jgi:DNA-binding NarL/FixJ family response regulator
MAQYESESPLAARRPVLLVDDEPAFLDAMAQGMAGEFEIVTAASAAEAVSRMAMRKYAVVICDHILPGEAGLDFLIRMRERHPETRRILLTGYINPELLSRSIDVAGLSACMLKPVRAAELVKAVREALGG